MYCQHILVFYALVLLEEELSCQVFRVHDII